MSRSSKYTFVGSLLFAGLTVFGVHHSQNVEREVSLM